MAMSGINFPLAVTGQEIVLQSLWLIYGVSKAALQDYFTGPGFLAWNRMSNIRGFGGPLPESWLTDQATLQARILERYSDLGLTPILPGRYCTVGTVIHDVVALPSC